MMRIIKEYQNNGKALEIRLEEETSSKYCVVIAGMTFNLKSGCATDVKQIGRALMESGGEKRFEFFHTNGFAHEELPIITQEKLDEISYMYRGLISSGVKSHADKVKYWKMGNFSKFILLLDARISIHSFIISGELADAIYRMWGIQKKMGRIKATEKGRLMTDPFAKCFADFKLDLFRLLLIE